MTREGMRRWAFVRGIFCGVILSGALTSGCVGDREGSTTELSVGKTADGRGGMRLVVDVAAQRLTVELDSGTLCSYPVSTATKGVGNRSGSNQTPLGRHRICAKIGDGQPSGMAFVSRKPTGERPPIHTDDTDARKDWILSRILWLEGLEPGVNRGGKVDSRRRYIYIHGTNEEGLIGRPASHGCVRMKNADVIKLFDLVPVGTEVEIVRGPR